MLEIPRHDDWDVSETYQRIDGVVPLESSLPRTTVQDRGPRNSWWEGYIYFHEEFLGRVFGAALGSERDKRRSGMAVKMRFRATELHKEASQILPFLQLPPGTGPAVDQRSSKLDGCRAEVDNATPKLNIAFPNGSKRLGFSGQVAACADLHE